MKLLVIGSRSITDFDLSPYIEASVDLIISGGADGIDTLAEVCADKHQISKLIMYPQYQVYGKGAPIRRNHQMVDIADSVLAVWDGASRGTADTIRYARKQHKDITVLQIKKDEA